MKKDLLTEIRKSWLKNKKTKPMTELVMGHDIRGGLTKNIAVYGAIR